MRTLAECPNHVVHEGRAGWQGSLREEKGGVELDLVADRPFALHLLDSDKLMASYRRCDGVLIAESGSAGLTCFLELKGAIDPEAPNHPFEQIQGGIEHFAPSPDGPEPHGEEHHQAWRDGNDAASAPRGRGNPRRLSISSEHVVAGAVIVVRGGTRHAPRWMRIAKRDVFVAVIQRHGHRGRVAMTLDEIEEALAIS